MGVASTSGSDWAETDTVVIARESDLADPIPFRQMSLMRVRSAARRDQFATALKSERHYLVGTESKSSYAAPNSILTKREQESGDRAFALPDFVSPSREPKSANQDQIACESADQAKASNPSFL
jgi:hypothetical protein